MSFYSVGQRFSIKGCSYTGVIVTIDGEYYGVKYLSPGEMLSDDLPEFGYGEIDVCTLVASKEWTPIASNMPIHVNTPKECTCTGFTLLHYGCKCK